MSRYRYLGFPDPSPALRFAAGGSTIATTPVAVQIATGQTGEGILQVMNESVATVYIGLKGVDSTGFPLPAGAPWQAHLLDVSTMHVLGSGGTIGWAVLVYP